MALAQVDGISADPEALAQQCFEAVRTLHVTWWLPDSLRTEAQSGVLPDQLHAYVRDVDLPDGYLRRYRPGLIFREPTFCDVSEHCKEGLAAKPRYFLLSGNARHVDSFFAGMSGSPGTGLCMFAPGTLWKVLAQIALLETPPVALHAFNCQALSGLEQGLADKAAEQFAQALQSPAMDACKGADWRERLQHPLGINDDGWFLESWFNGRHDQTAPQAMEEPVVVTTGSAAVRADMPKKRHAMVQAEPWPAGDADWSVHRMDFGGQRTTPVSNNHFFLGHGGNGGLDHGLRPNETAFLQPFGIQTQALAIQPQQLDDVTTAAPKHKDVATKGVKLQRALRKGSQAIESTAHVGEACCQPDPVACGQAYHAQPRSASRTLRTLAGSTLPRSSKRAPPISASMTPSLRAGVPGSGSGAGAVRNDSWGSTDTASSTGRGDIRAECWRSSFARRHLKTKLALTPCSRATAATDAPGCSVSSSSLRLKAALWWRLVLMTGEFDSCMVCTQVS
jgi:hypothetical protein